VTRRTLTLLPDPTPRERTFTVISVDDHIIEPPDMFEGRMPARFADRAPTIVEFPNGDEVWAYEDSVYYDLGLGACSGRPKAEWYADPIRFDETRRGCWDVHARVRDMDLDGVAASLCFRQWAGALRAGCFQRARTPSWDWRACGPGIAGTWRSWPARTPNGSFLFS
jgi:hypothetical protein